MTEGPFGGDGDATHAARTDGETLGREQQPTEAGDQDPANRAPRTDEPANPATPDPTAQPDAASDRFAQTPDATYVRREGQADNPPD